MRRRHLLVGLTLVALAGCGGSSDDDAESSTAPTPDGSVDLAGVDPCSLLAADGFASFGAAATLSSTVDFVSCRLEIGGSADVDVVITAVGSDVELSPDHDAARYGAFTVVSPRARIAPPPTERCESVVTTGGPQDVAIAATPRDGAAPVDLCALRDLADRQVVARLTNLTFERYALPPNSLLNGPSECALVTEEVRGIVGVSDPPEPRGYAQGCTAGDAGPSVSIHYRVGVDPLGAMPTGGREIDIGERRSVIAGTDSPAICRLTVPHIAFRADQLELLDVTVTGYPAEQGCLMAEAIGRLVIGSVGAR